MEKLKNNLLNLSPFYCLDDIWIDQITSSTPHAKNPNKLSKYPNSREYKLDKFESNECVSILLSIQILDECIDIPSCDSND